MLLQSALYIFLYSYTASIAAALSLHRSLGDGHLPSLHNPREEMQTRNKDGTYPIGYIHKYITLGEGINAVSVPVIETELPDDEDGLQARSSATPGKCETYSVRKGVCLIIYCWLSDDGTLYTDYVAMYQSKNTGTDHPLKVVTNNINTLSLSQKYNTGYHHWFPKNHACSNANTMIYTNHYLSDTITGVAYVDLLECDGCVFENFACFSNTGFSSSNKAVAWTSSSSVEFNCTIL